MVSRTRLSGSHYAVLALGAACVVCAPAGCKHDTTRAPPLENAPRNTTSVGAAVGAGGAAGSGGMGGAGGAAGGAGGASGTGGASSSSSGAGGGDGGLPPPNCACLIAEAATTACQGCGDLATGNACASEYNACLINTACQGIANCIQFQQCTTGQCIKTCYANNPGGETDFTTYTDCICTTCATDCNANGACP